MPSSAMSRLVFILALACVMAREAAGQVEADFLRLAIDVWIQSHIRLVDAKPQSTADPCADLTRLHFRHFHNFEFIPSQVKESSWREAGRRIDDWVRFLAQESGIPLPPLCPAVIDPYWPPNAYAWREAPFIDGRGMIVVTLPRIRETQDDESFAFYLCHEISHLALKHSGYESAIKVDLKRIYGRYPRNIVYGESFINLQMDELRYRQEHEADYLAAVCAAKAGYSPEIALESFVRGLEEIDRSREKALAAGKTVEKSVHPSAADRRASLNRFMPVFKSIWRRSNPPRRLTEIKKLVE